jgi:hypothetical protein
MEMVTFFLLYVAGSAKKYQCGDGHFLFSDETKYQIPYYLPPNPPSYFFSEQLLPILF